MSPGEGQSARRHADKGEAAIARPERISEIQKSFFALSRGRRPQTEPRFESFAFRPHAGLVPTTSRNKSSNDGRTDSTRTIVCPSARSASNDLDFRRLVGSDPQGVVGRGDPLPAGQCPAGTIFDGLHASFRKVAGTRSSQCPASPGRNSISNRWWAAVSSSSVPSCATCPATRIAMRSQTISSSLSRWLLIKTVLPSSRSCLSTLRMSCRPTGSTPSVGSSSITKSGSVASASAQPDALHHLLGVAAHRRAGFGGADARCIRAYARARGRPPDRRARLESVAARALPRPVVGSGWPLRRRSRAGSACTVAARSPVHPQQSKRSVCSCVTDLLRNSSAGSRSGSRASRRRTGRRSADRSSPRSGMRSRVPGRRCSRSECRTTQERQLAEIGHCRPILLVLDRRDRFPPDRSGHRRNSVSEIS